MAENNVAGIENNASDTGESSSAIVLHKDSLNGSALDRGALIERLNHILSFIRVLKARMLLMVSSLSDAQQRRSRSLVGNISVSEYKANVEEHLKKVEQLELRTTVFNTAIRSVEMEGYLNKSKEEVARIVTGPPSDEKQILDNFAEIVEATKDIIQASDELEELQCKTIKAKQEYVQKLENHRVFREERLAIMDANESPEKNDKIKLENMLQKKLDNLNIMRGIILSILTSPYSNIDFREHPELMEISKKLRKRYTYESLQ